MKIGFVGLGRMGAAMAGNLLKAGHDVAVYNRTAGKTQALVDRGATGVTRIADACRGDVVFTMLANDDAVEQVVFGTDGVVANLQSGAVHISSSTISVALSKRLAGAHAAAGQRFVAAPVFGRPDVAAEGRLFVVAGGRADAIEACMPLFNAIGQKTFVMSEHPEAANLVKLSGNFLIAATIEALSEAMTLVSKGGIDRHRYLDLLTSTLFNTPVHKTYGGLLAAGKYEPAGFAAALGAKDIRLTLAAAEDLRVPMPNASLLRDRFLALLAQGGDALDWSAIGQLAERDAAIKDGNRSASF